MALSNHPGTFPDRSLLSAAEVLGWIGFRDTEVAVIRARQHDIFYKKWLICDIQDVYVSEALEALEIRAKAFNPYCPVAWAYRVQLGEKPVARRYTSRFFSSAGPQQLRRIRASLRDWTGRLISYSEVTDELRRDVSDLQKSDQAMSQAEQELMEALRAKRIVARGRPRGANGAPVPRAMHEEIPFDWLCDREVTIRVDGIAGLQLPARLGRLFDDPPKEYSNVEFETKEVLGIWPKFKQPAMEQLLTPGLAATTLTIADERRLQKWLIEVMRNPSEYPQSKADMKKRATAEGHKFSVKGFNRAFTGAAIEADAPAWSTAGKKSKRGIETAV